MSHTEKWKAYTTLKRTVVILGRMKHNIHQVCLIMPFQWCSSAVPHPPGHLLLVWVWTWAGNKRARGRWLEGRELQHKDLCHNWGPNGSCLTCSFNTIRTPFPQIVCGALHLGHGTKTPHVTDLNQLYKCISLFGYVSHYEGITFYLFIPLTFVNVYYGERVI